MFSLRMRLPNPKANNERNGGQGVFLRIVCHDEGLAGDKSAASRLPRRSKDIAKAARVRPMQIPPLLNLLDPRLSSPTRLRGSSPPTALHQARIATTGPGRILMSEPTGGCT